MIESRVLPQNKVPQSSLTRGLLGQSSLVRSPLTRSTISRPMVMPSATRIVNLPRSEVLKEFPIREIFPNIYRCYNCGTVYLIGNLDRKSKDFFAQKKLHLETEFHGSLLNLRKKFGKDNVYLYTDFLEIAKYVYSVFSGEKKLETSEEIEDFLLKYERFEFSRSLRLHDYRIHYHPDFETFVKLLWNTPRFVSFVKHVIPNEIINKKVLEYSANRYIQETQMVEAPFYFGRVVRKEGKLDLSVCDRSVFRLDFDEKRIPDTFIKIDFCKCLKYLKEWLEREKSFEENEKILI